MFATLNGNQVTRGNCVIPFKGTWTADVWLSEAIELTGSVTLAIGDLTLKGAVTRGGTFTGQANYRLIGGAGGWMQTIEARNYKSPFGVKSSAILEDAARAVGESVEVTADRTLGAFFVRERAPAARVLNQLAESWWLREDGVTVVGARATPTITSPFEIITAELEKGRVLVATDFPAAWMPGANFSSPTLSTQQISSVVHKLSAAKLRTEVWTVG